jgi:hypothetical protein
MERGIGSKLPLVPGTKARMRDTNDSQISIQERNQQILQMRRDGVRQGEVARRFGLSPGRIYELERRDALDRAMAERRAKLQAELRAADDPDKMWPVSDIVDAIGLMVVARKSLLNHLARAGKSRISLRELMDMCLDVPDENTGFAFCPLLRVRGIGKKGFWSVVDGLTKTDLGTRCNEEWRQRLTKLHRS